MSFVFDLHHTCVQGTSAANHANLDLLEALLSCLPVNHIPNCIEVFNLAVLILKTVILSARITH